MARPMTTLKTGEFVPVKLTGRNRYGTFAFIGSVARVDDRALIPCGLCSRHIS